MRGCYKLKNQTPDQIAAFLIDKYNSIKVPEMQQEFNSWDLQRKTYVPIEKYFSGS